MNIEPIFAVMALYDAKEKKKISETFHLDCNPSDIQHMLDDHFDERSMASLSRSGIFSVTYPNSDVFLIIKVHAYIFGKYYSVLYIHQIEKVLQQGDVSDAADPYLKARDLDKKAIEKYKLNANFFCQQLGKYRMPFAWTAINVLELLAGNQVQCCNIAIIVMLKYLISRLHLGQLPLALLVISESQVFMKKRKICLKKGVVLLNPIVGEIQELAACPH